MSEKSRTPSPNHQRHFERGVFSSLSAVSFLKSNHEPKKTAGAVSPRPGPIMKSRSPVRTSTAFARSQPKSPDRSMRQASPINRSEMYSKEDLAMLNPSTPQPRQRDETAKLQEQVRTLTVQVQRERRLTLKAESEAKELERKYKSEVVQIQADVEVMKTNLQKAQMTNKSLVTDKDKAMQDLKAKNSAYDELKAHVKSLVTVFVDALDIVAKQDGAEVGLERVQKTVTYKLNTLKTLIGYDFEVEAKKLSSLTYRSMMKPPSVQSIYTSEQEYTPDKPSITYEVEFFTEDSQSEEEVNKYAPLRVLNSDLNKKAMIFQEPPEDSHALHKSASRDKVNEGSYAIAEYDFAAEQDGDLNIRKGELIQVLTKDESGWWFGRIGTRSGNFPCNYVHLV